MSWLLLVLLAVVVGVLLSRPSKPAGRTRESREDPMLSRYAAQRRVQEEHSSSYLGTVEPIKQLKREGRLEEALDLCLSAIEATEAESAGMQALGNEAWPVAPWYYEQAAIIYRKLKRPEDEIAVLRRYEEKVRGIARRPGRIGERLRKLEAKHSEQEGKQRMNRPEK